jgi:hypothetical protein
LTGLIEGPVKKAMVKVPARQSATPASLATPDQLLSFTPSTLSSTARKKMIAGKELSAADATVAEVNLRLRLYRFTPSVILMTNNFPQLSQVLLFFSFLFFFSHLCLYKVDSGNEDAYIPDQGTTEDLQEQQR